MHSALLGKVGQTFVAIGEAGRIRSKKFSANYFIFASAIHGVKIAAPIVLTQHKGHERRGEAQTPIVIELAY